MPESFDDKELFDILDKLDDEEMENKPIPKPKPKPKPKPELKVDSVIPGSASDTKDEPNVELSSLLMKSFGAFHSQIWSKLNDDRNQVNEYINYFRDRLDVEVKQCYVEALVALLNTKATTSMNATKILDSLAKMTAAVKNIKVEANDSDVLKGLLNEDLDTSFNPDEP